MSGWVHLTRRGYRLLLACYPSAFRAEFAEEMQDVFATALTEVQQPGGERPWRLFWREIRGWPGSVLQEHLRVRRRKVLSSKFIEEKPLSRSELLAAMIIFLLPLLFGIFGANAIRLPQWMTPLELILFLGPVLFALGLAVIKGLPRWSLSYLGFALTLGILFSRYDRLWDWTYPYFIKSYGPRSLWPLAVRIIYSGGFAFITIFSVLVGAVILVNLLRLVPYTRAVWQRIRADWTHLSFLLYGGFVVYVHVTFEEFRYDDMWKATAWICLALGAWFYLRVKGQKQRILALIGGATAAMWIVAIAKWVLIPLQDWHSRYSLISMEELRWVELSTTMIGWIGILIAMMAPALLNILPSSPTSDIQQEIAPARGH